MNLHDVKLRIRALFAPGRVERELDDELAFHVERETQKLVAEGMDPAEARLVALRRFGPLPLAADACRDERGISFVETTLRDVLYAFRTFRRAPLVAFTVVSTVALGLGLVAVAFSILSIFVFRVDAVPDVHEMVRVSRPENADGGRDPFTLSDYDALRRETSVFAGVYAEFSDIDARVDGRMMAVTLVTGNFFEVVGVRAALGRALTPADDDRSGGQPVVVLSDRGWQRHFASDPGVLGKTLLIAGAPHEIIGVMPAGFRGLSVSAPDMWAPLARVAEFRPSHRGKEGSVDVAIIGRLRPGGSRESALAQLIVWDGNQARDGSPDRRSANIILMPHQGTVPQPFEAIALFSPLFFAFGLILMIGCANVANLLLARAFARQREIGVRLSLGASRPRIIRQLLTESLLLALAAAAAAFFISRLVLEVVIYSVLTSLPPDIGNITLAVPPPDWRVVVFLIAGAVIATVVFGLMPALQATRMELVRTIRGEIMKDVKPGRARDFLIGLQVSASALLLICSAVFLRSTFAASTFESGWRTADTVIIQVGNEPLRDNVVRAVADAPTVIAFAASSDMAAPPRAAFADANGSKAAVAYKWVSREYFDVLDIPIVRGRSFTPAERDSSSAVAIVSAATAQKLWPNGDAVGQLLHLDADPNSPTRRADEPELEARTFTVVGLARDVAGFRISPFAAAVVYLPATTAMARTSIIARVNGDPERARQTLLDRLTIVDPNMEQILTMRTMAMMDTYFLRIAFWMTLALGGLALALTISGLFSVLSYLVEQRRKEIGVRMALGATSRNVTRLVFSQSIRPVGFGLLAGTSLAAGLAAVLLSLPDAAAMGNVVSVLDPVAYSGSVLFIIAACLLAASIPAMRASRVDPMQTLRED